MRTIPLLAAWAAAASLLGCGASPAPPADPSESMDLGPDPASDREQPPPAEPVAEPSRPTRDDSVPDDYALMRGDCIQLGKQMAALTRSDQAAGLSPKLTSAQRAQADKNIDVVATKIGDQYADSCLKSLVGQSVDPRSIKCAFDARTVKAFDECLNGPPPAN